MKLPLFLLILVSPLAAADVLTVLDISHAEFDQVERLKQIQGGRWLEMGLQLVVIGPHDAVRTAADPLGILARFDDVDPDRLILRAQGCSEHSPEAGKLLAKGGRWELRQVSVDEMQSLRLADSHAWATVTPKTMPAVAPVSSNWRARCCLPSPPAASCSCATPVKNKASGVAPLTCSH